MIQNPEQYLTTAGGRITCIRCKAHSSRTKEQCKNPALKGKAVCKWHGGMSTGPRTKEGVQRIREAHLKHGEATKEARQARSSKSAMFLYLRDIGDYLSMFTGDHAKGRKPVGYSKLDLDDPMQMAEAILKTLPSK